MTEIDLTSPVLADGRPNIDAAFAQAGDLEQLEPAEALFRQLNGIVIGHAVNQGKAPLLAIVWGRDSALVRGPNDPVHPLPVFPFNCQVGTDLRIDLPTLKAFAVDVRGTAERARAVAVTTYHLETWEVQYRGIRERLVIERFSAIVARQSHLKFGTVYRTMFEVSESKGDEIVGVAPFHVLGSKFNLVAATGFDRVADSLLSECLPEVCFGVTTLDRGMA